MTNTDDHLQYAANYVLNACFVLALAISVTLPVGAQPAAQGAARPVESGPEPVGTSAPDMAAAGMGPRAIGTITGQGTTGTIPVFTGPNSIGNSLMVQTGGNILLGTTTVQGKLTVQGSGHGITGISAGGANAGVNGLSTVSGGRGVIGTANTGSSAIGVFGSSSSGRGVAGTSGSYIGVYGTSSSSVGVYGRSNSSQGVYGSSADGVGIVGYSSNGRAGVLGNSSYVSGSGVEGNANGQYAAGVFGVNPSGPGAWGRSTNGSGVYGESNVRGVHGATTASGGVGVYGTSPSGRGIWGVSNNSFGVEGDSTSNAGVAGYSTSSNGVQGISNGGSGVRGASSGGPGVSGSSGGGPGVHGVSDSGTGVIGQSNSGYAGFFYGNVTVTGVLNKGAGAFKIDHPLDPANKFLSHSFVESPDMMNIYNGNITSDNKGYATVTLPEYFTTLNRDYRYQLTCIGQFAQAIVARRIDKAGSFVIRTDKPRVDVSWQVTGTRNDAYARAHRIRVVENKMGRERGAYLHPEAFGLPRSKAIATASGATPSARAVARPKVAAR